MILASSATEHSRWHMLAPLCIAVLVKESFKLCHFLRRFQTNVEISENGEGVPQKHPFYEDFQVSTNQLSSCWESLISGTSQNKEAEVLNCHCPQLGSYSSL